MWIVWRNKSLYANSFGISFFLSDIRLDTEWTHNCYFLCLLSEIQIRFFYFIIFLFSSRLWPLFDFNRMEFRALQIIRSGVYCCYCWTSILIVEMFGRIHKTIHRQMWICLLCFSHLLGIHVKQILYTRTNGTNKRLNKRMKKKNRWQKEPEWKKRIVLHTLECQNVFFLFVLFYFISCRCCSSIHLTILELYCCYSYSSLNCVSQRKHI